MDICLLDWLVRQHSGFISRSKLHNGSFERAFHIQILRTAKWPRGLRVLKFVCTCERSRVDFPVPAMLRHWQRLPAISVIRECWWKCILVLDESWSRLGINAAVFRVLSWQCDSISASPAYLHFSGPQVLVGSGFQADLIDGGTLGGWTVEDRSSGIECKVCSAAFGAGRAANSVPWYNVDKHLHVLYFWTFFVNHGCPSIDSAIFH